MKHLILVASSLLTACATTSPNTAHAPFLDAHQHLVSPAFAPTGADLVRELDAAGVRKAVVLSVGYSFGDERKALTDPDRLTRAENDWTAAEVAKHPARLIGFCSANPLRDAALAEIERCLGLAAMTGIKVHMGNAGLTLRNPQHLARMQQLFALAQRHRAPVLVHMRARGGTDYGAQDGRLLLEKVVPFAPSSEVIVAHLGASSPGYPAQNDEVMAVFGEAAARKDPMMRNIYFDVSANITEDMPDAEAAQATSRIRQVGAQRVLYGSDLSVPGGTVAAGWEIFRRRLALTEAEIRTIAANRPRFAR